MDYNNLALHEQCARIARLLMQERLAHHPENSDLNAGRHRLLALTAAYPGVTENDLVSLLAHRTPAARDVLAGVEAKGYLTLRAKKGSDERIVELTEAGQSEAALGSTLPDAFAVLSDEERKAVSDCMARVLNELERTVPTGGRSGQGIPWARLTALHGPWGVAFTDRAHLALGLGRDFAPWATSSQF